MGILEIVLIIVGAAIIGLTFLLPDSDNLAVNKSKLNKAVENAVNEQINSIKSNLDDLVAESIDFAEDKTERKLERLTNEKIMAISEYSDTVLKQINDNHNEVMFLYDMLNDKQKALKETVKQADKKEKAVVSKSEEKKTESAENKSASIPDNLETTKVEEFTKLSQSTIVREDSYKNKIGFSELTNNQVKPAAEEGAKKKSLTSGLSEKLGKRKEINRDQIVALRDAGKTDVEIAKELGMGVGEVNLILNIHSGKWDNQ